MIIRLLTIRLDYIRLYHIFIRLLKINIRLLKINISLVNIEGLHNS
jgi:hypothetical protein